MYLSSCCVRIVSSYRSRVDRSSLIQSWSCRGSRDLRLRSRSTGHRSWVLLCQWLWSHEDGVRARLQKEEATRGQQSNGTGRKVPVLFISVFVFSLVFYECKVFCVQIVLRSVVGEPFLMLLLWHFSIFP